jgi:dihydrofolate reductase
MSKVTASITVSLDGYVAGPHQSEEKPFGDGVDGGDRLHSWMFDHPEDSPAEIEANTAADAFVMGRNMFGPVRGAWDRDWRGWWGEDPPFHAPVFVLTHHPREPVEMAGGTTFHFVTDGIESALSRAREAAGEGDVAIAGGAETINQYLAAGMIDELRLQLVPFTIGAGARLFDGVPPLELEVGAARHLPYVTHLTYRRPRPIG